jgi:hypothetical protein
LCWDIRHARFPLDSTEAMADARIAQFSIVNLLDNIERVDSG